MYFYLSIHGRSAGERLSGASSARLAQSHEPDSVRATHRQLITETYLSQSDIDSVETFLIFIGWPRSCHSIIGSMLDAHPNVVIAHDYFLFRKLKLKRNKRPTVNLSQLYSQLFYWSTVNDDFRNLKKGYSLNINGSWQGSFTELKVIGDKSGRSAVVEYIKDREMFKKAFQKLENSVKVPIKVLQVVRNPLDMIATKVLFTGSPTKTTKVNATVKHKYRNFGLINKAATHFVNFTKEIIGMIYDVDLSPLEVHCEDLISHPSKTMSDICQFLDLECSPDYLQMCVDKTFKNVSESRHLVDWDPNTLPSLIDELRTFPFFQRYKLNVTEILN